jgi:hypothetical protein
MTATGKVGTSSTIDFQEGHEYDVAHVVTLRTTLAEQAYPFGQVTDGLLVIDAKVALGRIQKQHPTYGWPGILIEGVPNNTYTYIDNKINNSIHFDLGANDAESVGKTVYFVPLRAMTYATNGKVDPKSMIRSLEGLILISTDETISNTRKVFGITELPTVIEDLPSLFRRFGVWKVDSPEDILTFFHSYAVLRATLSEVATGHSNNELCS